MMKKTSPKKDTNNANPVKALKTVSSVEDIFTNRPLSNGGKLIIFVGFFLLFPIRLCLLLIINVILFTLGIPVIYLMPKSSFKKIVLRSFIWIWGKSLFFILGVFVSTKGRRRKKNDPPAHIVVSNHVSWMEAYYLITELGCSFVGKAGLQKVFIIGKLLEEMGTLFVPDRLKQSGQKDTGRHAAENGAKQSVGSKIIQRVTSHEAELFPPLCIFPEGTTSNGRGILHFHKGAFLAGVPVMPVAIRYPNAPFDLSYCNVSIVFSYFCTLCTFPSFMEVNFLPVYLPSEEEKQDPELYSKNVQTLIAEALNLPIVDKTYADKHQFYVDIGFYKKKGLGEVSQALKEIPQEENLVRVLVD